MLKTQCGDTENPRFSGNVIWEKVERLKREDKVGISESLRTNPCIYLRCKNENLKTRRHRLTSQVECSTSEGILHRGTGWARLV